MRRKVRLLFVMAAAFVIVAGGIIMLQKLDQDIDVLEGMKQQAHLQEREAEKKMGDMQREIKNKDTDTYIMENARNRYGYLMPGEIRFEVANTDALHIATPSPAPTEAAP